MPPFSSPLPPRRQKLCDQTKIGKSRPFWLKAPKPGEAWKVLHSPREIFRESLHLFHMNRQHCCLLLIGFLPVKKHDKNPYCWGWPFRRAWRELLLFIMKQTLLRRWPLHRRTLPFRYQQKKDAPLPFSSALDLFSSGYDQTNLCSEWRQRQRQQRMGKASFLKKGKQQLQCCKQFVCNAAGTLSFKSENPYWVLFKALLVSSYIFTAQRLA